MLLLLILLAASTLPAQYDVTTQPIRNTEISNETSFNAKGGKNPLASGWVIPQSDELDEHLYYEAERLAAMGKYREAFDSVRLYCERYYMRTYPEPGSGTVANGLGHAATYALAENSKTGSTAMLYEVYNWLVFMQPKNSDCDYYQSDLFSGLARILFGLRNYNEACNMYWNYIQLCPDNGWRDSMYYGFIKLIRGVQKDGGQDTTPFYLYEYPLKPLIAAVARNNAPDDLLEASLSPNPAGNEVELYISMKVNSDAYIGLIDQLGREVKTLYHGKLESGERRLVFDIRDVPTGQYYLRIQYGGLVATKKLVINR